MLEADFPISNLPVGAERWEEPAAWDMPFRVYHGLDQVAQVDKGGVAALGNFDGVHLGHAWLIACAVLQARSLGVPSAVLTFSPHPRKALRNHTGFLLADEDEKQRLIGKTGVNSLFIQNFDKDFAAISPEEFVVEYLARRLGLRMVIIGSDFAFGRGREGSIDFLAECGRRHGIVVRADTKYVDGLQLDHSSTRVRALLGAGEVAAANRLLGRYWRVSGCVRERAGELSISFGDLVRPSDGIYSARIQVETDDGVASGHREVEVRRGAIPEEDSIILNGSIAQVGHRAHIDFHDRCRPSVKT